MNNYTELFRLFDLELRAMGAEYSQLITHNSPATVELLNTLESKKDIKLCDCLVQYYLAANGSMFADEEISQIEVADYDRGYFILHAWGNGDFDVVVNENIGTYRAGSVLFVNHNFDATAYIADDLAMWFIMLKTEILERKHISHPSDYINNTNLKHGTYYTVLDQLRGTGCELFSH